MRYWGARGGRATARVSRASRALQRPLDLAGLEAAGADVGPRGDATDEDAHALQVGVEAALRGHHGVAAVVAEAGLSPAQGADFRHVAGGPLHRAQGRMVARVNACSIPEAGPHAKPPSAPAGSVGRAWARRSAPRRAGSRAAGAARPFPS